MQDIHYSIEKLYAGEIIEVGYGEDDPIIGMMEWSRYMLGLKVCLQIWEKQV